MKYTPAGTIRPRENQTVTLFGDGVKGVVRRPIPPGEATTSQPKRGQPERKHNVGRLTSVPASSRMDL
jgi:hypothetical protein